MKVRHIHYAGLALLSYALVLRSGAVSATSSESTGICFPELIANGDCDTSLNTEACGYDGGDCCECTCLSTADYACGESSDFECVDPSAYCDDDDDLVPFPEDDSGYTSTFACETNYFSDADCDENNNNEQCGYDGGDCCECTCVTTTSFTCGASSHGGYACLDPSALCVDDDDYTTISDDSYYSTDSGYTSTLGCNTGWYSDGLCDTINNNEECGYDGGDCCQCTCVSTTAFTCGEDDYACVDPGASCVDDDDYETLTTSLSCIPSYISDGYCDLTNNNEECDYDGGDCCECTCVSTDSYICGTDEAGSFACLDPFAPCVDEDDYTTLPGSDDYTDTSSGYTSTLSCFTGYFADGYCDEPNNNEGCRYDGGDCCECTCISTEGYICGDEDNGGFACVDPSAPCVDDDDVTTVGYTDSDTGESPGTGDDYGYSGDDLNYNDDGDDSEPTFLPSDDSSSPGGDDIIFLPSDDSSGPGGDDIGSYSSDDFSDTRDTTDVCVEDVMSDGACDAVNNNEQCGYDGLDCCECDCVSTEEHTCGDGGGFDCVDPSSACVGDYVEAGTKTTVGVSANAYDTRPGEDSGDVGCGEDGCTPTLSRDGITTGTESRWACAQKLVSDGSVCEIEFTFEEPQDIKDVEVVFYKGDERSRTLEAAINGEVIGEFDSYTGSTFNSLGIEGIGVEKLTFSTVGLTENDWISLVEVRFLVEP